MSPSRDDHLSPPERDALAGEYVLGLLDGAEFAAAERRLDTDRDFAASVERWRLHFFALDATVTPLAPSVDLWPRIEAGLAELLKPAASFPAATSRATMAGPSRFAEWWNSLFVWRGAAFAGALATVVLAVGLFGALDRAKRQPLMVAVLLTEGNAAAAVVHTFADGRVEMLPLQSIDVPAGKALEIWTLWDRAVGPRSVGLIDRARSTPLRLDNLPLGNGQLFEITLEPASGSPTGRPTGPIIAKGTTSQRL
ncbi:Anti-sigma-K factor RskA [Bosea sp. 62]|uniref:anti-sigma factor n=1 Tax=unclassified Bosea (in: a-proteobacteria) TaxID=2653178 RepID=UPI001255D0BD|nr:MULTISPECIES: anti-sigma factor [unclassified Bosea (in: a-proteobacteria)]CAD5292511.1 Anti-sigma-K factor RskA [Bosea sp. 7B]CAD5299042.1 Anti-sigma-K factor RskA [Bosea sp. 21B]CAD5299198.1 Anti-sigma-K factor RskA [Bosea sp. 46]VVT61594.1 Anti-sigma-K factor RskA [Bosea sp. EC-HK365B]VXB08880.1 Anti-sigma-K factor RskA [Bosea sp. 127]